MKALIFPLIIFLGSLYGVYYSLEQTRLFEEEQTLRLDTKENNRQVTAKAEAKEKELKDALEVLAATKDKRFATLDRIKSLKGEAANLRTSIAEQEGELARFEAQKRKFEDTRDEVEKQAKSLSRDYSIDSIETAKTGMTSDKENRETKVDELNTLIAAAEKSIEGNTAELARQVKREAARQMKISRSALEAVVTGVNQDWGFLIVGAGSNSGFTPQSSLLIERDGRMIAKARPSSIEPTQTIAEINFDTLASGVRLQPGDKVIIENPTDD